MLPVSFPPWPWPALALLLGAAVALAACEVPWPVPGQGDAAADGPVWQGWVEGEPVLVAPALGGRIETVPVAQGDRVIAGQVLFTLDDTAERAALAEARARLAQARAEREDLLSGQRPEELAMIEARIAEAQADFAFAEREFARQAELVASNVGSRQAFDRARRERDFAAARVAELTASLTAARLPARAARIDAADSAVIAAEAALDQARWALDQRRATAPRAGVIEDIIHRPGEVVAAGTAVLTLLPPDARIIRFYVPQADVAALPLGRMVEVTCDGCPGPIRAAIRYRADEAAFTPPVLYSRDRRDQLVFLIEAVPQGDAAGDAGPLPLGLPVDVHRPTNGGG